MKFLKVDEDTYEVRDNGKYLGDVFKAVFRSGARGWANSKRNAYGFRTRKDAAQNLLMRSRSKKKESEEFKKVGELFDQYIKNRNDSIEYYNRKLYQRLTAYQQKDFEDNLWTEKIKLALIKDIKKDVLKILKGK